MRSIPIAPILETLCFAIAISLLRSRRAGIWRLFIPYLALIALGDWAGWLMMKRRISNLWLYNISTLLEASFTVILFGWLFSHNRIGRRLTNIGFVAFLCSFCYELVYKGIVSYVTYAQIVLYIWIIILSLAYYHHLLKNEEYVILSAYPEFWFVTGTFLFAMGCIASNLFFNYFHLIQNKALYPTILNGLCFILYGCWSYAFICKYRKKISL